jgi:DNA-directed RNA polymerase specialized sigma24 family protein
MSEDIALADLLRRLQAGDEEAARHLVHGLQGDLRAAIRQFLLKGSPLSHLESTELCEDVLASFCRKKNLDKYDLTSWEKLGKYLRGMARKKFLKRLRRQRTGPPRADLDPALLPARQSGPGTEAAIEEWRTKAQKLLTAEEWQLIEWRREGHRWDEIAGRLGAGAEAVRKKYERAVARVERALKGEEADDA